jgi:hypothetical protein
MHDQPSPAPRATPRDCLETTEQAVLALLVDEHPAQLSRDELMREFAPDVQVFVDDALHALVGAGLAHRHGPFIFATRAAVTYERLQR